MNSKTTPKKSLKPAGAPLRRKSSLTLSEAHVEDSPLGTKTFNFTMKGDGEDEDYSGAGLSPPRFNKGGNKGGSGEKKEKKEKKKHDNEAGEVEFGMGQEGAREAARAEAEEQARMVAEMLGEGMNAGDLAAEYDVSDSSDDGDDDGAEEKEEEKGGEEGKFQGDFDWGEQMGPVVEKVQGENQRLKAELAGKKAQLKKMGIMLDALEPVPGLDAEKVREREIERETEREIERR